MTSVLYNYYNNDCVICVFSRQRREIVLSQNGCLGRGRDTREKTLGAGSCSVMKRDARGFITSRGHATRDGSELIRTDLSAFSTRDVSLDLNHFRRVVK